MTIVNYPSATINSSATDICAGDTAFITASTGAGYNYTWYFNNITVPGVNSNTLGAAQTGNYSVVISNGGCVTASTPIPITAHKPPVVSVSPSGNQFICPGNSVQLSTLSDPSYNYTWLMNGIPIPNANGNNYNAFVAGTYEVQVSNAFCAAILSNPVSVTVMTNSVDIGNDTVICNGSFSIPASVGGAFPGILWSTGETSQQINITSRGKYWVTVSNICGNFSDTLYVRTLADFEPALPTDTLICNAENKTTLSVPHVLQSIKWSTGETSSRITITTPGKYFVEVDGPCGVFHDSTQVNFCAPDIADIIPAADSICEGECTSFNSAVDNYPLKYSWKFEGGAPGYIEGITTGTICYPKPGIYAVTLTVFNAGGEDSYTKMLHVINKPLPRFADTTITISYKSNIILSACADAMVVDWYKDGKLICANCPDLAVEAKDHHSLFHCVVRNVKCADSCRYDMWVTGIPHDLRLPSAFSPNGDGLNDLFRIITDNPNIVLLDLSVYNRWGERIFSTESKHIGWDGTHKGMPMEIGTYFWSIRYKVLGSHEVHSQKGDVTLIR